MNTKVVLTLISVMLLTGCVSTNECRLVGHRVGELGLGKGPTVIDNVVYHCVVPSREFMVR